jgi:hypothetical protein
MILNLGARSRRITSFMNGSFISGERAAGKLWILGQEGFKFDMYLG